MAKGKRISARARRADMENLMKGRHKGRKATETRKRSRA